MRIKIDFTLLAVLAVDLLATTGDSTMTWSSPVLLKLESNDTTINPLDHAISENEESWVVSLINIGSIIGPFFYGYLSGKIGRKLTLLSIAIPHFISFVTMAFARNIYLFYFGRLLGGIAVGGGYTLMPMYVAEVAEKHNRGKLSATLNCFWTLGNFLPYCIGPYISIMWFNLFLACLPITFFTVFFIFASETPYYLVGANKIPEAEKALMYLRSSDSKGVAEELEQIQEDILQEENGSFLDLFKDRTIRKALFISLLLISLQQLVGINVFLAYMQIIFDASGSKLPSDISAIIVGAVFFSSSFITPFLSDRLGRKILLIISCFGMMICLVSMGLFFYLLDNTTFDTKQLFWLPVTSLIVYVCFFNLGMSPIPWTISSELFPSSVKSAAASATSCMCWSTSFVVMQFFNDMKRGMGTAGTFWLFGGFSFIAAFFCIFFVPETKGKSFAEIQTLL